MDYLGDLKYQADLVLALNETAPQGLCCCGPCGGPDTVYWAQEEVAESFARDAEPLGCRRPGLVGLPVGRPSKICPKCGGEMLLIEVVFDEPTLPYYGD